VTPILDEYSLEARLGLEAALRRNALPPTGGETVTDSQWLLDTPPDYRNEICRTDRALSALLSGDHLAAASHVETAGPVGAALICLRVAVQAQRLLAQDSATDSSNELQADRAARYLAALTQCVAIPPPDRRVWDDATIPAADLYRRLLYNPPATEPPLTVVARDVVARSLLCRQAFAATFLANFAALLHITEESNGGSALDCAKRHTAMTIAYLDGHSVAWDEDRLRLDTPPTAEEPAE